MAVNRYEIRWQDAHGKKAVNRFFAGYLWDAIWIAEDLTAVSAASWIEMRENGAILSVSSPRFALPATSDAYEEEGGLLEMRASSSGAKHQMRLPAVLPSYVSESAGETDVNPFRALHFFKTSEGEPFGTFVRATYRFRNRATKDF